MLQSQRPSHFSVHDHNFFVTTIRNLPPEVLLRIFRWGTTFGEQDLVPATLMRHLFSILPFPKILTQVCRKWRHLIAGQRFNFLALVLCLRIADVDVDRKEFHDRCLQKLLKIDRVPCDIAIEIHDAMVDMGCSELKGFENIVSILIRPELSKRLRRLEISTSRFKIYQHLMNWGFSGEDAKFPLVFPHLDTLALNYTFWHPTSKEEQKVRRVVEYDLAHSAPNLHELRMSEFHLVDWYNTNLPHSLRSLHLSAHSPAVGTVWAGLFKAMKPCSTLNSLYITLPEHQHCISPFPEKGNRVKLNCLNHLYFRSDIKTIKGLFNSINLATLESLHLDVITPKLNDAYVDYNVLHPQDRPVGFLAKLIHLKIIGEEEHLKVILSHVQGDRIAPKLQRLTAVVRGNDSKGWSISLPLLQRVEYLHLAFNPTKLYLLPLLFALDRLKELVISLPEDAPEPEFLYYCPMRNFIRIVYSFMQTAQVVILPNLERITFACNHFLHNHDHLAINICEYLVGRKMLQTVPFIERVLVSESILPRLQELLVAESELDVGVGQYWGQ